MATAVKRTLEREIKLAIEPGFVLPALEGKPLARRVFTSTYHDTADRRLLAASITLRRRVEQRRGVWQLKLPTDGGRAELEATGSRVEVPGVLADLLPGVTRGRPLGPVATLRTQRTGVRVDDGGGGIADVTLDDVSVLEERRTVMRFAEIEVELVAGGASTLTAVGRALRREGARKHDGRTKLATVLSADEGHLPTADDSPDGRVKTMLNTYYGAVVSHDPGVRLGDDPEDLHQMRVATRRLRATLRAASELVDAAAADALRAELAWLGDELGRVRDVDVLIESLETERATFDGGEQRGLTLLVRRLRTEREDARQALDAVMRSDRYFGLLDALEGAPGSVRAGEQSVSLKGLAAEECRKLRRASRELGSSPGDADFHAFRIRVKRARYAAELAGPFGGKRAAEFVERAKELQDVIGEHQDAVVAEGELRRLADATRSRQAALASGRLIERQQARKARARRRFRKAWARLDEAGKRAWR